MLNIFGIENKAAFRTGTYISIFISTVEVLGSTFKISSFTKFIQLLPLGKDGFAWLIPCILGIIIAYLISSNRGKYKKNF